VRVGTVYGVPACVVGGWVYIMILLNVKSSIAPEPETPAFAAAALAAARQATIHLEARSIE
jgi:hypothetical protein